MKIINFSLLFILLFSIPTKMHSQNIDPIFSKIKAITLRLKPGDDLKMQLDAFINMNKIKAACIITCVGSLKQATIRYANKPNADTLHGHFEMVSLTGTLAISGSHLHISISDSTGKTIGGHLKEGSVIYTTAEVVLGIMPDLIFSRETDNTYGYKELMIKEK